MTTRTDVDPTVQFAGAEDEIQNGLDDIQLDDRDDPAVEDDNDLALRGIVMLLNNKWDESLALFEKYKDHSIVMHFGGAFVEFMQAMMSLEDEKVSQSRKVLEEVEKKCKTDDSFLKRIKKKIRQGSQLAADVMSQEDKWTCQIIAADTLLYQAVLAFINQDISSYVKGGWLLRKAWKVYERVYHDISQHHVDGKKFGKVKVKVDAESAAQVLADDDSEKGEKRLSSSKGRPMTHHNGHPTGTTTESAEGLHEVMSRETISRLLGAASFGYGMFQLLVSLLPEKILKLIEFLGFHGDREAGLKALEFSMESADMRAPLAVLSMLWYHVIMKPFFTETLTDEELKEATELVHKYQALYPDSSIFLFFKGRLCRLKCDLDGALAEYEQAKQADGQEELRNAAVFEISWCNMMKLNYDVSYDGYSYLITNSKWSKCFYTYMLALCSGSRGKLDKAADHMKAVPGLVRKKTNQIEAFVSRRAQQFKKLKLTENLCQLLILELIYMWNSLPQCSQQSVDSMISICGMVEEKKFFHLRSLIEGALYRRSGDLQFAEQCFKEAIARQEGLKFDHHVSAHALYELGTYYTSCEESKDEGRKMLLKAKDGFKEYDFENRLNVRIRNALNAASESCV